MLFRSGTFPACWFRPKSYLSNEVVYPSVSYNNISGTDKCLTMRSSSYGTVYAVSPAINTELNHLIVNFVMKYSSSSYAASVEVGVMSNPNDLTTFVPVKSFTPTNTEVADYSVMLDNVTMPGVGNYIAFKYSSESSYPYVYIDDIEIDSIPTCITPSNVRARRLSTHGAVLDWNSQGNENSWNVKISTKYMSRPSNATGNVFEGTVSADSIVLTGLKMGVTYYGAVQAQCADGSSLWERVVFTTICGTITELPYIEDFTDYGTGSSISVPCWGRSHTSYPFISSANNSTMGKGNSGSLYFSPSSFRLYLFAAIPHIRVRGYHLPDLLVYFKM